MTFNCSFSCEKVYKSLILVVFLLWIFIYGLIVSSFSFAQEGIIESVEPAELIESVKPVESVEIESDHLEFSMGKNKVIATGNVSISKDDVKILCDKLEYYRDNQIVIAEGNVVLIQKEGRFEGEKLKFNMGTMKGDFQATKIFSDPFFGVGEKITKTGDNHLRMHKAAITTCDLEKPHFTFYSKKIDIYPGDKAVARNVRLMVGKVPLFFIPKFTQDLRGKKPALILTPGFDKQWGIFLLTKWFFHTSDNIKATLHFDWREKKDVASGIDTSYDLNKYGDGIIRTYYMNERNISSRRFYSEKPEPTIERERFKVEWRHKWDINDKTNAIWQYYKLSDDTLLQDYFDREYDEDTNPSTYFLLSRVLPLGSLSLQINARVNRFVSALEKLPEIIYDISNKKIAETNFYFKSKNIFSNFAKKSASPSEIRQKTKRFHTDNELSYLTKIAFIEFKPFVGGLHTYYSRLKDSDKNHSIRGIFKTGADLSAKFYRIFDIKTRFLGMDIDRLRHIITPSIAYKYVHDPTIPNDQLDEYDSIETQTRSHTITFGVEHKFQTKRDGSSMDLLRASVSSGFSLKENPGKGGFQNVNVDIEVTPYDWLSFYFDARYDTISERLASANFDLYINDLDDTWYLRVGKRYNVNSDDQLTMELGYVLTPKWTFKTYQRFELDTGIFKETQFSVSRDLHCWILDINYNRKQNEGDEIWMVFTMKAFPELGFDFGSSFNKRKPGSQNNVPR